MNRLTIKARNLVSQYKIYFKSSFLYLSSSLFTAAIGIAVNPFMAKNLSPEDYAIIGYFNERSIQLFKENFSDMLIEMGYESDENWK